MDLPYRRYLVTAEVIYGQFIAVEIGLDPQLITSELSTSNINII